MNHRTASVLLIVIVAVFVLFAIPAVQFRSCSSLSWPAWRSFQFLRQHSSPAKVWRQSRFQTSPSLQLSRQTGI